MREIYFRITDLSPKDTKTSGYTGYYIIVSFTLITSDGFMGSALKADLDDKGEGRIYLPDVDDIEGEMLNIEFYGPAGYWVAGKQVVTKTLFSESNNSQNKYEFGIDVIKDKALEKFSYSVRGRLVDVNTGIRVSRKEIYVLETETEDLLADNYKIIHALTTDLEGYFKFEMPFEKDLKKRNKFYYAHVPSSVEKVIPFSTKDRLIEEKQILGIQLATNTAADPGKENETDCACDNTPRLPGSEELARGEGVFSQDLGVGCVEFTKPNRVVEEHQFMQIVRTTDPQIKKVNLSTDTFKEILNNLEKELEPASTEMFVFLPMTPVIMPQVIIDGLLGAEI